MKTTLKRARTPLRIIAVPTDFLPGSTSAMAYALALAATGKGRVVAVHAVDPFEYSFGPKDLRDLKKQEVWAQAQQAMAQWLQINKFSGCTTKVVEGEAGPAIATFIDQRGIDLTVLGTSARRHAAAVRADPGRDGRGGVRRAGRPVSARAGRGGDQGPRGGGGSNFTGSWSGTAPSAPS